MGMDKVFLGGVRNTSIMTAAYEMAIQDNIVLCPNLEYLGMARKRVKVELGIIKRDCLSKIALCDRAIFYVENDKDLESEFIAMEITYCEEMEMPYEIIYVESVHIWRSVSLIVTKDSSKTTKNKDIDNQTVS